MRRSKSLLISGLIVFSLWLIGPSTLFAGDSVCPDPNQPADPTCNPECEDGDKTIFCACHKIGSPDDPKGYNDHCSSCESRTGHCCHGDLAGMCNGCGNGTVECCTFLKDGEGNFILDADGNRVADECCEITDKTTVDDCKDILPECEAEACDDGNNDSCAGSCSDDCKVITCDDGNSCTDDSCDVKDGSCVHTPVADGEGCDAGDGGCPDMCVDGECRPSFTPPQELCVPESETDTCHNVMDDDCDGPIDSDDPDCDGCDGDGNGGGGNGGGGNGGDGGGDGEPQACPTDNITPVMTTQDLTVHFPPRPSDPDDAMVTPTQDGGAFIIDILSIVNDPDNGPDPLEIQSVRILPDEEGKIRGSVMVADGGTTIIYVPPENPSSTVTFAFQVFDGDSCNGMMDGELSGTSLAAGGGFCGLMRSSESRPRFQEVTLGMIGVALIAGILRTVRSMILVRRRRG